MSNGKENNKNTDVIHYDGGKSLKRMAPLEPWKAPIVSVRRNPFSARLDSHGGQICIGNQVSPSSYDFAEIRENFPVPGPGRNQHTVRPFPNLGGKCQSSLRGSRIAENTGMRYDSEETAQN